jgi:competence protein ComEC
MVKTLPWCLTGWLFGTALQLQQASLWSLSLVLTVGCLALSVGLIAWLLRGKNVHFTHCLLGALISFGLALSLVNARCLWQAQHRLNPLIEGKEIKLSGIIASLPQHSANGVRFRFQVQSALELSASHNVVVPKWIDLAWYDRESVDWMTGRHWAGLKAGDTWQFNVRLKAPHGTLNRGALMRLCGGGNRG